MPAFGFLQLDRNSALLITALIGHGKSSLTSPPTILTEGLLKADDWQQFEVQLRRYPLIPAKYSATSSQLSTRTKPVAARLCGAV